MFFLEVFWDKNQPFFHPGVAEDDFCLFFSMHMEEKVCFSYSTMEVVMLFVLVDMTEHSDVLTVPQLVSL